MTTSTLQPPGAHPRVAPDQMEKYSSASTLSDMEVFVFPELLFSLVLANAMSPRLWAWRDLEWFKGIEQMKPMRRIHRLRQFIIDHYEFNLDLDTWGLTTKEKELARFRPWLDEETIGRSNALFGYEGDKYYFSLDIRRHFGLDKYTSDVIPYWKTETLEAMDAFRFRPGYARGAGECVSLSTLYAAALFVVCRIPLEDIYLMATPLHSQNFIDVGDGVLTNNRRVVTKNMWFNGTEQTAKAQRALQNEQVTIVAHHTGYIHVVYPEATIAPAAYQKFKVKLKEFLSTDITMEILANFLRDNSALQKCFQIAHAVHGKKRFIAAEKVYAYEHSSSFKVSDGTREKLLAEIEDDEYFCEPIPDRIVLNKFEDFFKKGHVDLSKPEDVRRLVAELDCQCTRVKDVMEKLVSFARLEPRLPDLNQAKHFVASSPIVLTPEMRRDDIVAYLESMRARHPIADLAFYAARDLSRTDWAPFLKAALERNPVSIHGARDMTDQAVAALLASWPNESVYDGSRVAQPDEVWNYRRGDGLERALCLANILKSRNPDQSVTLDVEPDRVSLHAAGRTITWPSAKGLHQQLHL